LLLPWCCSYFDCASPLFRSREVLWHISICGAKLVPSAGSPAADIFALVSISASFFNMASRNRPDGKSHGEQSQPKRQGNNLRTQYPGSEMRQQNCASATTEHQPERSQKLCETTFAKSHKDLRLDGHSNCGGGADLGMLPVSTGYPPPPSRHAKS